MSHLDDDALAELALGGGRASDAEHAAACAQCRTELESLLAVLTRAQTVGPGAAMMTPPDRVWDAIASELAADEAAAEPSATASAPEQPTAPERHTEPERASAPDELAVRRERRGGSRWALAAAAAAGVVVGGIGVGLGLGLGADDEDRTVVAQAPLTDLATEAPAGDAVLATRADGSRVLVVETTAPDIDDAYLEVWLIDEAIDGMVSLGHLSGGSGEFVIPEGFDVGAFPIVDISVEPLDGVPTHSGDSVTRGVLDA